MTPAGPVLRRTAILLAILTVALGCAGQAAAKNKTVYKFGGTGCGPWKAPSDASVLDIEAIGAAGLADGGVYPPGRPANSDLWVGTPGYGSEVKAVLNGPVAGMKLDVCVDAGNGSHTSGGGASGVSIGSTFAEPAVVAGGGGAAGLAALASETSGWGLTTPCCNGGDAGISGASGQNVAPPYSPHIQGGSGATALSAGNGGAGASGDGSSGDGALSGPAGPGAGGNLIYANADNPTPVDWGESGGAGYAGGGAGSNENDSQTFAGGGGGSDYCAPLTPSRSDAKLPSKFSTSDCKIINGVGTKSASGTAAGDAEVIITSIVVPQPPVAAITWPFMDERFVTSGTASRAGPLSPPSAPGAGAYPPIAKFSCIPGAHAAAIKSCTAVVTTDPGSRIRAPKTRAITNGQTLPASTGGAYPSYVKDSLTVTAVSKDGKKTKQTDFYYVYIASTYPITPPGIHPTP
jgi:hypothetical protein